MSKLALRCAHCGGDLLQGELDELVVLWDSKGRASVTVVHKWCTNGVVHDSSFCGEQLQLEDPFVALYGISKRYVFSKEDVLKLVEIFFALHLRLYPKTKINPHMLC